MNKHDKTRYVFAQAIKGLIKVHPLDKIAVTDIVTRSRMTRQTFYRYFKDKYDLVNWYFEKLVLKSFRQMGDGCSLQEALQLKFAFIKSEHSFFKEAFKSNDYNNLVNYDFNCIYEFYKNIIEKNLGQSVTADIDFLLKSNRQNKTECTVFVHPVIKCTELLFFYHFYQFRERFALLSKARSNPPPKR